MNEILKSWRVLNHHMHTLTEAQLKELLDAELAGACRYEVLKRLHQRFTTERTTRERSEILAKARAK